MAAASAADCAIRSLMEEVAGIDGEGHESQSQQTEEGG
jgi:hypothetical protein